MSKARVIITMDCRRNCVGCCNTYDHIMSQSICIKSIRKLPKATKTVCVTGGEPMLNPDRTLDIIKAIRTHLPRAIVYLYTALYDERINKILDWVDGVHYTLHAAASKNDVIDFYRFQTNLIGRSGSYRIYIDPRVSLPVVVDPSLWSTVIRRKWQTEQELVDVQPEGLPVGETLYILDEA